MDTRKLYCFVYSLRTDMGKIKRISVVVVALGVMCVPAAHAEKPVIVVINHSSYISRVSYTTLYEYLRIIEGAYPIYKGVYRIYLEDSLPLFLFLPKNALGGHTAQVRAYINVKGTIEAGIDPYVAITHELAEMAVDPYLKDLTMEIGDNRVNHFTINGHTVADFKGRNT